jgi:hypothetical protein
LTFVKKNVIINKKVVKKEIFMAKIGLNKLGLSKNTEVKELMWNG